MIDKDPNLSKTKPDDTTSVEADVSKDVDEMVDTEHVNEGDMAARSPDRRDQVGQPFDGSINETTAGSGTPQSTDLHTLNRYANVDNAQTRVLSANDQKS